MVIRSKGKLKITLFRIAVAIPVILVVALAAICINLLEGIHSGCIRLPSIETVVWLEDGHIQVTESEGVYTLMYDSYEVVEMSADIYCYEQANVYYFKANNTKAVIDLNEKDYHFYRGRMRIPERYVEAFNDDDAFHKLT